MSSTKLYSKFKSTKNFLSRRFTFVYDAELECQDRSKLDLLLNLTSVLAASLKPNTLIKNIKGRDRLNLINKKLELAFEHELLNIQCSWDRSEFGLPSQQENCDRSSFGFFILSPFDSFEGRDIYHKVSQVIVGEAPPETCLESILHDRRFQIESFRIGIDSFGQSSFANWFISAPVVVESILIECYGSKLLLRLQSEGHRSRYENLYALTIKIPEILEALGQLFNLDLQADLKDRQSEI